MSIYNYNNITQVINKEVLIRIFLTEVALGCRLSDWHCSQPQRWPAGTAVL